MTNRRKRYTPEEKVRILALHLLEDVPIADLCQQTQIHRTVFYRWQREFFGKGCLLFRRHQPNKTASRYRQKIVELNTVLRDRESELLRVRAELERLKQA